MKSKRKLHPRTREKQQEKIMQEKDQQQFLSEASRLLSTSLSYKKILQQLSQLVVPTLGDYCVIDILGIDKRLHRLGMSHKDKKKDVLVKKLHLYPPDPRGKHPMMGVIRNGKTVRIPYITSKQLKHIYINKQHRQLLMQINPTSYLCVPLIARGKIIGAISIVATDNSRVFTRQDTRNVEDFAHRAALAIDNAKLYQRARSELLERKRAEAELRKSRDQLEIIFKSVADGITVQDPIGKIVYANDTAAFAIGYKSPDELINAEAENIMKQFILKDEKGNSFPLERLPGRRALLGELQPEELICYTSLLTGEENWSITKARPVFDERGNVLYAINVFHDITERKKLEERKDDFISIASHELKTPITSVKAFTQILQKRFIKAGDEESVRYLSKMDIQLNKLTNLIRDLLDINKIQTGRLAFHKEIFYFDSLVDEIIEDFQRITEHTIIKKGNCHLRIDADRDRLSQVIINLLTNAIKYSPKADKIFIHGEKKNGKLLFSVKDFGTGIPKEHYKKIFGRFFRGVDSKKETFPGLGVGLYISAEIIKRHNGKIWVESKEGEGSTFYFSIPTVQ